MGSESCTGTGTGTGTDTGTGTTQVTFRGIMRFHNVEYLGLITIPHAERLRLPCIVKTPTNAPLPALVSQYGGSSAGRCMPLFHWPVSPWWGFNPPDRSKIHPETINVSNHGELHIENRTLDTGNWERDTGDRESQHHRLEHVRIAAPAIRMALRQCYPANPGVSNRPPGRPSCASDDA